ncbi:MAG: hypothetical protein K2G97_00290, partial [Oscillospiraceae bacterium]|nr:hypothetical protein [Oscillospiraceae bacterium]
YNSKVVNADVAPDISLARDNTLDDCRITFSPLIDDSISERCARSANHRYEYVLDSVFAKFKNSEILKAIALTTIVACIASVVTGVVIEETAKEAYVGGFCGYNYCKISGSISESEVKAKTLYNKYTKCGGFVGANDGVVEYCNAYGKEGEYGKKGEIEFKMHAGGYLGGFVGENISNIYDCKSKIDVKNGKCTGGFCGYNEGGIIGSENIDGNAETDAKTSTNTTRCGGFVGYNKNGSIEGCKSQGNAKGNEYVGGFCGDNVAKIANSSSTGSATANAKIRTTKCGGFVGENSGTIDNSNCNSGVYDKIIGQEYVGGFVGMNKKNINKCSCITKHIEAKTETHNTYVGGFVGVNSDGTITECNATNLSTKTDISKETRSVEAKSNSGQAKVGGFVGVNKAKIKKSNSTGHHI